jgi:DNA-binding transcriptional MerR regulator
MEKSIGIKVLSMACGVLPHAIRTWETRYQVFTPSRNAGGQRSYSESDLIKARLIGVLLSEGHTISKLARLSIEDLESLKVFIPAPGDKSNSSNDVNVKNLLSSLSHYNIDEIVCEMQHLRMNCGAKDFIFKVIIPIMREVGVQVSKGALTVTQEHIVSTIVRDQLGQLSLPNVGEQSRRVVLATPDGNMHELSILIAEIICRSNRIPTSYLGASHPTECLGEAVNALKVNTIVLGAISSDKWDYGNNILNYLQSLDKILKRPVEIILGGGWEIELPTFLNIKKVVFMDSFDSFDKMLMDYKIAL